MEVMSEPIEVSLTLNGVEWIKLGTFHYFEPKIDWIGIAAQLPSLNVSFLFKDHLENELKLANQTAAEYELEKEVNLEIFDNFSNNQLKSLRALEK